jgi:hypothetical protein
VHKLEADLRAHFERIAELNVEVQKCKRVQALEYQLYYDKNIIMSRPLRIEYTGAAYHVTSRGEC